MATKSKKNTNSGCTSQPSQGRKRRLPAFLRVPCPPEVARWQRPGTGQEPYRQISQERAAAITGRSMATVRRWATGRQAMDSSSLRLLQVWVWGLIPSQAFLDAGIFIARNQRWHPSYAGEPQELLATQNGYLVTPGDLESFGWLQAAYRDHWDSQERAQAAQEAQDATPPPATALVIPFAEHLARRRRRHDDTGTDPA